MRRLEGGGRVEWAGVGRFVSFGSVQRKKTTRHTSYCYSPSFELFLLPFVPFCFASTACVDFSFAPSLASL